MAFQNIRDIEIKVGFYIDEELSDNRVKSLVKMAGNSLIDSFVHEVQAIIMHDSTKDNGLDSEADLKDNSELDLEQIGSVDSEGNETNSPFEPSGEDEDIETGSIPMEEYREDQVDFDRLSKYARDFSDYPLDSDEIPTQNDLDMSKMWKSVPTPTEGYQVLRKQMIQKQLESDFEEEEEERLEDNSMEKDIENVVLEQKEQLFSEKWSVKEYLQTDAEACQNLEAFVFSWCEEKYNNKGLGIEATKVGHGQVIQISFYAWPDVLLKLSVEFTRNSGDIYGKTEIVAELSGSKAFDNMLKTACHRMTENLVKDLRSIRVDTADNKLESMSSESKKDKVVKSSPGAVTGRKVFEIPNDSVNDLDEALTEISGTMAKMPDNFASSSSSSASAAAASSSTKWTQDIATATRAKEIGVDLNSYAGTDLQEKAVEELQKIINNSKQQGFIKVLTEQQQQEKVSENVPTKSSNLEELFTKGKEISELNIQTILNKPNYNLFQESAEDMMRPPQTFPMFLKNNTNLYKAVAEGEAIDLLSGPQGYYSNSLVSNEQPENIAINENDDPFANILANLQQSKSYEKDVQTLQFLLNELNRTSADLYPLVLDAYKDLLLSDNILLLMQIANKTETDMKKRVLYSQIIEKSLDLHNELATLIQTESIKHLETIFDICEVAKNFQHDSDKFLERIEYLKPRFDTDLLSYLTYAIQQEEDMAKAQNIDFNLAPSEWHKILLIVKNGVLAEFERRYDSLLETIFILVRFEDDEVRRNLWQRFVNITNVMDLPYLRELAINMAENIISGRNVDALNLKVLDNKLYERMYIFKEEIEEFLSEELIENRIKALNDEVSSQGLEIGVKYRNSVKQSEEETLSEMNRKGAMQLRGREG